MTERQHFGEALTDDPDDAPLLLPAFFEDGEIRQGETVIRPYRGPGRPKTGNPKQLISVRLDADVVAKLREAGSGWQSQINALLRQSLVLKATGAGSGPVPPQADPPRPAESSLDPVAAAPPPVAASRRN